MTTRSKPAARAVAGKPAGVFLRQIGWNVAGQLAPLPAALLSIPILIAHIGLERFGLLTIGWMIIGYFSFFDLGVGRAMTQLVAARLGMKEHEGLSGLIWTGMVMMVALGLLGAVAVIALSGPAVSQWLNVPVSLREEALSSLYMLAPAVPLVVATTGLRGVLEARQEFRAVNLIRIPSGVLLFVAPLIALPWTNSLVATFAILLLVRIGVLVAMFIRCWQSLPEFRRFAFSPEVLPDLMKFGGWMTVSNIISPLLVQMDRFLIGGMLSLAAVAHYAAPFEMVTKVLLIPGAINGVAFPAFSRLLAQPDAEPARRLYWRCLMLVAVAVAPLAAVLFLFAEDVLRIWLATPFPPDSVVVMKVLLVGIFVNSLAHVPFAYLQGAKRADVTAKIHLAEAPVYAAGLVMAVSAFGIVGAAAAWTLRVTADAIVMHIARAWIARDMERDAPAAAEAPQKIAVRMP
jgi:O-antigen/teichoic acid export membrane protein